MTFDEALKRVLRYEGGYVNHPSDPGGETNLGITVAVARAHGYHGPMRSLPRDVAAHIYRVDYWDKCRCDELPERVRYPVFDAAVNSGPRRSIMWLQQALGVEDDGVIGPATLAAALAADDEHLAVEVCTERLAYLKRLKTWPVFGKGWGRRVADVMAAATAPA